MNEKQQQRERKKKKKLETKKIVSVCRVNFSLPLGFGNLRIKLFRAIAPMDHDEVYNGHLKRPRRRCSWPKSPVGSKTRKRNRKRTRKRKQLIDQARLTTATEFDSSVNYPLSFRTFNGQFSWITTRPNLSTEATRQKLAQLAFLLLFVVLLGPFVIAIFHFAKCISRR